jgi:hypothetical protein
MHNADSLELYEGQHKVVALQIELDMADYYQTGPKSTPHTLTKPLCERLLSLKKLDGPSAGVILDIERFPPAKGTGYMGRPGEI